MADYAEIVEGSSEESKAIEDLLRKEYPDAPPAPKVEVIVEPARPTKLFVSIPADNPRNLVVQRVEVLANGDLKTLEEPRAPTGAELAVIKHGKREVLSGGSLTETADGTKRPWWHYALGVGGALAVAGGGYLAYSAITGGGEYEDEDED